MERGKGLGEESMGFSMPPISRTIKKSKQIKNLGTLIGFQRKNALFSLLNKAFVIFQT